MQTYKVYTYLANHSYDGHEIIEFDNLEDAYQCFLDELIYTLSIDETLDAALPTLAEVENSIELLGSYVFELNNYYHFVELV